MWWHQLYSLWTTIKWLIHRWKWIILRFAGWASGRGWPSPSWSVAVLHFLYHRQGKTSSLLLHELWRKHDRRGIHCSKVEKDSRLRLRETGNCQQETLLTGLIWRTKYNSETFRWRYGIVRGHSGGVWLCTTSTLLGEQPISVSWELRNGWLKVTLFGMAKPLILPGNVPTDGGSWCHHGSYSF